MALNIKDYVLILNDLHPLRKVVVRSVVVLLFWVCCLYIMSVVVVVAGIRYPKHKYELPDLGFDVLSEQKTIDWLPNMLMWLCGIASVIRFIFHRRGLLIMRRIFFIHAITMLLRCMTLVATSYPDPSQLCEGYSPPLTMGNFWLATIGNSDFVTCGDLMFSGHTLYYVILALSWHKHTYLIEKIIFWMVAATGVVFLIVVRLHYTNDVLVAIYVSITVWHFYHIYATDPYYQKRSAVVAWLEADVIERDGERRRELLHTHPDEVEELFHRSSQPQPSAQNESVAELPESFPLLKHSPVSPSLHSAPLMSVNTV